jgi:hypothetical protein
VSDSCNLLHFVNGTYETSHTSESTGIGAGFAEAGGSLVREILMESGLYNLTAMGGAAISRSSFASKVRNITILRGDVTAISAKGSGVGAGHASWGRSEVDSILIVNCSLTVPDSADQMTGIGSGASSSASGVSRVSSIVILNGSFRLAGRARVSEPGTYSRASRASAASSSRRAASCAP